MQRLIILALFLAGCNCNRTSASGGEHLGCIPYNVDTRAVTVTPERVCWLDRASAFEDPKVYCAPVKECSK